MNGALFNLGPHAMYEGGAALRILKELGCLPEGGYALKGSMIGILSGSLLDVSADLTYEESQEWIKVMAHLNKIDTELIHHVSLQEWIDTNIRLRRVRLLFQAMCRQWSYCSNMQGLSAGFVIKQGQLASQGVFYIENGWQTVVDSLKHEAVKAGARICTDLQVKQIIVKEAGVDSLIVADETEIETKSIVSAIGPQELCNLLADAEDMSLGKWKNTSYPLYGACLDVALKQLPYPERVFALGLDQPVYYSKHSGPVKLSDNDTQVLHLMRYNDDKSMRNARRDKEELLQLLDLLQPGWNKEVTALRYTANAIIAHDARTISHYVAGPALTKVPEIAGLYVAGDWVGDEGRLADACMASAKAAAENVLRHV